MTITETACKFDDFPIGQRVKIISEGVDFYFFYGETGEVIKNDGKYLGITVEFDKPREFEGGIVQTHFGFNPENLCPLKKSMEFYE